MAGAGGTAPKKGPTIDDLREALIPELLKHLGGPEPTPPQYQPTPISPMQGYAIARNPQAAGLINQQIQGPAQAQYQQQQAAFEQAMSGRHQAMNVATSLTGQDTRADAERARLEAQQGQNDIMNQIRMLGLGIQEQRVKDAEKKAADAAIKPDKTTVAMQTGLDAVQNTIDEMRGLYTTAVQQHGPAERNIQETLQSIPVVRNVAGMFDPAAQQHEALRNKLVLQLNKPISGQQRLLTAEINQLLKYVPAYGTDPRVAIPQFDSMQRMIDMMKARYATPAPAQPPQNESPEQRKERMKREILQKHGAL